MMITTEAWWTGVVSYSICHLFHILWWRYGSTSMKTNAHLFLIFIVYPSVIYPLLFWQDLMSFLIPYGLHFVLSANYIAVYPAAQASSPLIEILYLLKLYPAGISEKEICQHLSKETLVGDRVGDLTRSRLASIENEKITLSWTGKLLAGFFVAYRRYISLPTGGG